MSFVSTSGLSYQSGDLFVGRDGDREIGVQTDRHAITIAGSRSGKGAAVIIPNLLRWPHNALVIDPKGENAEKTYAARLEMGQAIHVIDPYEEAKEVPQQLRGAFNPLGEIDKDSLTASTDLEVIADGLVKRSDPKHAQWDDGAVSILAGLMAFTLSVAPTEEHNLMSVRRLLAETDESLRETAEVMMSVNEFDGLARSAAVAILTGLDSPKSMEADFIGAARRHTKWLDKRAMRQVLEHSTFKLSDLKTGDASVYLVLPPDYLENDGAFLRLFVRCAISAMARGGSGKGNECLFILDEFYSLGKMDVIQKSSGSMPSYGVHLWPFLQDLGQLLVTYGTEGAETFFANSDLHQFFGNADPLTLNHVSMRLGTKTANEVAMPNAPSTPISSGASMGRGLTSLGGYSQNTYTRASAGVLGGLLAAGEGAFQSARQADYADEMQYYQQQMQLAMSEVGTPRYPPDQIGKLVQQRPKEVAPYLINFVAGVGAVLVKPAPYFQKFEQPKPNARSQKKIAEPYDYKQVLIGLGIFLIWMNFSQLWQVLYLPVSSWFYSILTESPVTNSLIIRAIISLFFVAVILLSNKLGALKIGVSVGAAVVVFGLYYLFFGELSQSIASLGINHPMAYLIPFYFWGS
jgi:type IV secretion system protein VirD4